MHVNNVHHCILGCRRFKSYDHDFAVNLYVCFLSVKNVKSSRSVLYIYIWLHAVAIVLSIETLKRDAGCISALYLSLSNDTQQLSNNHLNLFSTRCIKPQKLEAHADNSCKTK